MKNFDDVTVYATVDSLTNGNAENYLLSIINNKY